MNPLGDRRRAEELARLLEGAVTGPGARTAGYAALAARLRQVAPALDDAFAPRAEFRALLRRRLLAVAAVQDAVPAPEPAHGLQAAVAWSRTWKAQRRIAAAAGVMAAVVGVTGVGVASSRSLPGQPFYGVKRAVEGLQLDLTDGDTAKGAKHLELADTRLREVRALAAGQSELALGGGTVASGTAAFGGSRADRIRRTLADFDHETRTGRTLLEGAFRRTGRREPLKVLTTFSAQSKDRLASLLPDLPLSAAPAAEASLALVTTVATSAETLLTLGTCGDTCTPTPTAPVEPAPSPGASASPSGAEADGPAVDGGQQPDAAPTPEPTPEPTAEATDEPTAEPTPTPTPTSSPEPSDTPSPTPSPSPSGDPVLPLPDPLPDVPLPLPTDLPLPLPTITLPPLLPKQ